MEKLPRPLLCCIYMCGATSRIQLQLPTPEQQITHWRSTAIKEKISKDVLAGKAAHMPGAGNVYVCWCEHAGTVKALKALALIWKYFGSGRFARFAAEKIVFAVRSLQCLTS